MRGEREHPDVRAKRWTAGFVIAWSTACTGDVDEGVLESSTGVTSAVGTSGDPDDATSTSDSTTGPDTSTTYATTEDSTDAEGSSGAPEMPEPGPRVLVEAGLTDDAERVKTLAVARQEDAAERSVVLRIGPEDLPNLREADRLIALAEVQVTTRCDVGQMAAGCNYDPKIRARLVLRGADGIATALGDPKTETCTKGEHHCTLVFPGTSAIVDQSTACITTADCALELEMWAWDPSARADGVDRVLVGENEGDYLQNGEVKGDKARLMAVRERDVTDADRTLDETTAGGEIDVPTDASAVLVYSHPLGALREGEQVVVDAKIVTAVGGRARVSSKMFVTDDPDDAEGPGFDGVAPKQIGEHNGTNCTPGASPCTTRKVAVFRATADHDEAWVNVVIRSAVPGGGTTSVTVKRDAGWLRSTRYAAELGG